MAVLKIDIARLPRIALLGRNALRFVLHECAFRIGYEDKVNDFDFPTDFDALSTRNQMLYEIGRALATVIGGPMPHEELALTRLYLAALDGDLR